MAKNDNLLKKIANLKVKQNSFPTPLNAEEEHKLLVLKEQGDKAARQTLILHNTRLVAHIAKKFEQCEDINELISIGFLGLVKAVDGFKLEKNTKLSTYIGRCVENEILMHLRKIKKTKKDVSLEFNLGKNKADEDLKLVEVLTSVSNADIDEFVSNISLNKQMLDVVNNTLSELEIKVINLKYGFFDGVNRTQQEVAEILNCSRSNVSHIERAALKKLKEKLELTRPI